MPKTPHFNASPALSRSPRSSAQIDLVPDQVRDGNGVLEGRRSAAKLRKLNRQEYRIMLAGDVAQFFNCARQFRSDLFLHLLPGQIARCHTT